MSVCRFDPRVPSDLLLSAMTHVPIPQTSHLMLFFMVSFKTSIKPQFFDARLPLLPPPVAFHSLVAAFHIGASSCTTIPAPPQILYHTHFSRTVLPVHIEVALPGYEPSVYRFPPLPAASRDQYADHLVFKARLSLKTNETPVGCVLVHDGRVIARGMNATNITRNGTRHAELMALTALLSYTPNTDVEEKVQDRVEEKAFEKKKSKKKSKNKRPSQEIDRPTLTRTYTEQDWGDVDPKDGHIYPYGQKLHPAPRVDRALITESTLYVTVEPCVMCASMLRQFGIKKVYFGAVNDKFGGTGGVFCIHMNSDPAHAVSVPATPVHRPVANQLPRPALPHKAASCTSSINGSQDGSAVNGGEVKSVNSITFVEPPVPVSNMSMGHGGNVERGFEAEGGWGRDEAVNLLRQFYVQENGRGKYSSHWANKSASSI